MAASKENNIYLSSGHFRELLTSEDQIRSHCADLPPGVAIAPRSLPPGILVIKNYLPAPICRQLVEYADQQKGEPSTVEDLVDGADEKYVSRKSTARVTEYIDIDGIRTQVLKLISDVFFRDIQYFYNKEIEWFEYPEILRYKIGGYYWPHSDADNWDKESRRWVKSLDRDYSMLIYLNDTYTGGEIDFPNFKFRLSPEAGMLVAFPSDHRYLHAARPTTAGKRYVIVSWSAARGTERVREKPPAGATFLSPET